MKRIPLFLLIAFVAITMINCSNKAKQPKISTKPTTVADKDSMVYGRCGEGTAMHTVELIQAEGKSTSFTLESEIASSNVLGGLTVGDSLAILSRTNSDGQPFADIVINLTSLEARWSNLNTTLSIYKDGKALTEGQEKKPMTAWRLHNGRLVIGTDTFTIRILGPDSLYLEQKGKVVGYRKMPN